MRRLAGAVALSSFWGGSVALAVSGVMLFHYRGRCHTVYIVLCTVFAIAAESGAVELKFVGGGRRFQDFGSEDLDWISVILGWVSSPKHENDYRLLVLKVQHTKSTTVCLF